MATTVYGGYAKSSGKNFLKLYFTYTVTSSNTSTTVAWSAGTHVDSGYTTNAKITVAFNGQSATVDNRGWGGGNHQMISGTITYTRGTSASTKTLTPKLTLANGNTSTVSVSVTVPALTSYNVTFSANGGSGAPATQKKFYNTALTLSTTKPTRTGYTFKNWSGSNGVTYAAGGTVAASVNQALTLTAQWTANTYTITYNANGGTGSIASQTKTYGSTLSPLSDGTGFTRARYNLLSWNTKADGSGTTYQLGGSLSTAITANTTLYAQWELAYVSPTITNFTCYRTETSSLSDNTETDDGAYIYLSFDWTPSSTDGGTTTQTPLCKVTIGTDEYTPTLTSGTMAYKPSTQYSKDSTWTVKVELYDTGYESYEAMVSREVATAIYPIDLYGSGNDVYMGIMHPYVAGQKLTLSDTYIDGDLNVFVNEYAASGTTDKDLYDALVALGWL